MEEIRQPLTLCAVPLQLVDVLWSQCTPHLQRVVDKAPTDISLDTIKAALLNGAYMLITVSEGENIIAVNLVEQVTYPTGHRVLFVPAVGGNRMEEWMDRFMQLAHAIAQDLNCNEIRGAACRRGWLKALNSHNHEFYELHAVVGCKVKQIERTAL